MIVPAASIALVRGGLAVGAREQRVPELLLVDPERLQERRQRDAPDAPRRARAHEPELVAAERAPFRDAARHRVVVQRDVLADVVDERRVHDRAVLRDLGADPVHAAVDDLVAARVERVDQAGERLGRVDGSIAVTPGSRDRSYVGSGIVLMRRSRAPPRSRPGSRSPA